VRTKATVGSGFEEKSDWTAIDDVDGFAEDEASDAVDESAVDGSAAEELSAGPLESVEFVPRRARLRRPRSEVMLGLWVGALCMCVLTGLAGWQGVAAYHARAAQQQRQLFLQAGRQGALDLTTIRYTDVDADIQRVLDGSTGKFYDESSSTGTVSEAGIETMDGNTARVLVSTGVRTAVAQAPEQEPRYWRMRLTVTRVDQELPKVSDVEFVP
jgi:Mce-associated membrane protein